MAAKPVEKITELPISKIHADYAWNCRQGDPAEQGDSDGELDTNEYKSLVESLRARGQDQPVIVRPRGQGFALVVGFRRYRALTEIANGDKNFIVKAIVRELDEIEARSLNIRENTARSQLKPADLMFALVDLKGLYTAKKAAVTVQGLANEVGVGRGYASKLFTIHEKVAPKWVKAWRESPVEIGVNKLEALAKLDKGEQQDREWEANIAPSKGRGAGGGKNSKAWLERAEKEAAEIGTLLGFLEYNKKIDTSHLDFDKDLEFCIAMKEGDQKATTPQRKKLVEAITEAYNAAMDPPKPEEPKIVTPKDNGGKPTGATVAPKN